MENRIILITYPDSLGGNIKELNMVLEEKLKGAVYGVHILPFFPSTADRGFAPVTYDSVAPAFGSWEDIEAIGKRHPVAADFMINHMSRYSEPFQDFLEKKEDSAYKNLFVRYKDFWENGEPTEEQASKIFKRKPKAPYEEVAFADGSREKIWCTFGADQMDLDFRKKETKEYIKNTLEHFARKGIVMVRLDAFAYTTKYRNTSCFFVEPYIWDVLEYCKGILDSCGVEMLPELHGHYSKRLMLSQRGYWVYDFALPMLVLHALYSGEGKRLADWIRIAPHKQFTTLDTHDGIGVIDVQGLLSEEEIEFTVDYLYRHGANVKKVYNSEAYQNMDIYQLNCTYYSALGDDDRAYLLARAIQFFTPGIPQVYYVGMLCGKNDIEYLEKTKEGRSINRHNYSVEEIEEELKRPIVEKLLKLMRLRNQCSAFEGKHEVENNGSELAIRWSNGEEHAELKCNLKTHHFTALFSCKPEGSSPLYYEISD